jgi:hypothetical protein
MSKVLGTVRKYQEPKKHFRNKNNSILGAYLLWTFNTRKQTIQEY